MRKYLPIGSVVLLKDGKKKVMIYGRRKLQLGTTTEWDYIACLYPEGNIDEKHMYLFNNDQVETVFHRGFENEEEDMFRDKYLDISRNDERFI